MDWLYIPHLILERIDDIVIALMTGIITSLFISRIFLINQDYQERFYRVTSRLEALYSIGGGISFPNSFMKEETGLSDDKIIEISKNMLLEKLKYESQKFSEMYFEDLDSELHEIAANHHTLIDEILNIYENNKMTMVKLQKYNDSIEELIRQYYANRKKKNKIVFKSLISDKYILVIIVILIAALLIA